MKETELKFRVEEYDMMKSNIEEAGAEYEGKYQQVDLWLDTEEKRLKREGKGLRIRQQNGKTTLTLKDEQTYTEVREAEELEVELDNFERIFEILKRLGFKVDIEIKKERETWKLGNLEIDLDRVENLGTFLELEGSREEIENAIKKLGLEGLPRITKHYGQLYEEHTST